MTDTRLLVAAALREPSLAGLVILALDRFQAFDAAVMDVALAVAALRHRGEPGGIDQVAERLAACLASTRNLRRIESVEVLPRATRCLTCFATRTQAGGGNEGQDQ